MTADVPTRDVSRLPVVRVHTFEVSADHVTVERMPMLKRMFIREAAGFTGDMPKLLRGETL